MSKIQSVIKYLYLNYPHSDELSNARLTKMIYLADWYHAKKYHRQITDITWYFNNYGPFVEDVMNEAMRDPEINVIKTATMYGTPKVKIEYIGGGNVTGIESSEMEAINHVIEDTSSMYWNKFITYVYGTYPIATNPRYSNLDLVQLAQQNINNT